MDLNIFKPQGHALALEPRIMFDGAAAVAVDPHHADTTPATADRAVQPPAAMPRAAADAAPAPTPAAPAVPQQLLVVDSRVDQRDLLTSQPLPGVKVLVVGTGEDGLAAISNALAQMGHVDSIQILSHGAAGQFTLGNRTISSDNVDQLAATLESWRATLAPGADIQLYGCDVGAGVAGQQLVNELARWTGADVGASRDDTGNAAAGGNWTLETVAGAIDKPLALSASTVAAFDGLLADAAPTVTLSSAGDDAILGGNITFTASFSNPSTQTGFAPYIDLFIPATGKDGAGAEVDDGLTFVSATYLGQNIRTFVLTFDAAGNATHPLARDTSGAPLIIHAADYGMRPGDQFVVLQLPNASIIQGQPPVDIAVTLHLSNLADTTVSDPAPDLTVRARGGFQFGNDSADDPTSDPVLIEAGAPHAFVVHPTMVKLTQVVDVPDGGTVTGPNYPRTIVVTAETATDQTLNGVVISQDLPPDILVKAITPGANGTLTQVTLYDGRVLTSTADIAAAFAAGAYVQNYQVTYATLTGTVDTTISFYVPEVDANGVPVLDPVSGAPVDIPVAAPTASANWTPLDTRDIPTGPLTGAGNPVDFLAQSIAVYKPQPTIAVDAGSPGIVSPGDTLTYSLEIQISDFFAFGKNLFENGSLVINDLATDGQTFVDGSGTLEITINGVTQTIPLVATAVHNPDGSTSLSLDLAQSLRNAGNALGAMPGDLAFDSAQEGATRAVITYQTVIGHDYTTPYPHDPINEGDTIGNNATVTGTILEDQVNLTGGSASDGDSTTTEIPTSNVDIEIATVNGVAPTGPVELRPGDIVTFTVSYDLLVDDYEQFVLSAFLPLPLFDTNISWTQGPVGTPGNWNFGPGNTNLDTLAGGDVTGGTGNSIIFNYGDFTNAGFNSSRVELQFTMQVSNTPFGDQRSVTVLAQSDQLTTVTADHIISEDAVVIQSIAEPVLSITHGVVSSTQGTITGTSGAWNPPGSGGVPFTGSITDPTAVNGDITGIDGGDLLRMATAIENTGGLDAFDVVTSVTLPAGLAFEGGSLASTLRIYRGDGSLLVAGTDYTVTGNTVSFIDGVATGALRNGRAGTANDVSGANIVVMVYDVRVDAAIAASSTLASTAAISAYAASNGGPDFLPITDLSDKANQQVAAPTITKVFADGTLTDNDSSAAHTTGADLVVGESMLYDVVVTIPEGSVANLRLDDLVPPGMLLDGTYNGIGYEIIQTVAGSGALTADFAGTLTVSGTGPAGGGTVGDDGVDARLTFSAATNAADNDTGNNSFVIRIRLIASNTLDNQAGRTLANGTQLTYSDPDGDVAGGAAVDRVVAMTGAAPTATLREPTLTVTQTHSTVPPIGLDAGDPISYTITISNTSGFDAFDISLSDLLPDRLVGLTIASVTPSGNVVGGVLGNFVIGPGGLLQSVAGANIDIGNGGSIVIVVQGQIGPDISGISTISNTVQVQWTSLDGVPGAPVVERTGVDGPLAGGTLNDYQSSVTSDFRVVSKAELSRVGGLTDTPAAAGDTLGPHEQVAVGEIIRYRANTAIAEGFEGDYTMTVTLDQGLQFLNDGTVRIAFVANEAGISSSNLALTTGGALNVTGNETSALRLPIPVDLSGPAPAGVMNIDPSVIEVTTDANGRTVIIFHLSDITNADVDTDFEFISIEFNARVSNDTSNLAGKQLGATLVTATAGTTLATSETVFSDVVEPSFNAVDKRVVSFTPNSDAPGAPDATTSTANVAVSFTQNGTGPAYDVRLVDSFTGVGSYTFTSITIGGTTYLPGTLPAGVTVVASASGITATFARIDPGTAVVLNYSVSVDSNLAYANTDAVLTWSSLPESFTSWGGSPVGPDATVTGERDGSGGGTAPNTYVLREGAGLGLINGALWDDTNSADASTDPDGPLLGGQTVTLTWAGADGVFGAGGDDATFTTVTDAFGTFHFSALAAGNYRVDAPTPITLAQPTGELRVRIDSDGGTLGQVSASLGEGIHAAADTGYVQRNDAPVNTVPGTQTVDEDATLNVAPITIADVDANNGAAAGTLDVILSVLHGTLDLSSLPPGVTPVGNGTASMTLSGTLADLNAALALVTYKAIPNYNGPDTLTVTTRDRGNFGDFNDNGIPGEIGDQLQDVDTIPITVMPVNDPPQGVNDNTEAIEAGGPFNGVPGVNPTGNLLDNDTDVDLDPVLNQGGTPEALHLVSVTSVATTNTATPNGNTPVEVKGLYGSLFFTANGGYQYVVDNSNLAVQALRLSTDTLTESFSYQLSDLANATATGPTPALSVVIHGANDTPVGVDDTGAALEAGGASNGTPGTPATGNVLTNDTDVDSVANGEGKTVTGIRNVPEADAGPLTTVPGTGNTVIAGTYGTLTIDATGAYSYVVDQANATVQALAAGQVLHEIFSYQVTDVGGLNDLANLDITITGANDNPVATDDVATAVEAGGVNNATPGTNPGGNVLTDGTPDSDLDGPAIGLAVSAVRTGAEAGSGTAGTVGTALAGQYGSLVLGADGSYTYTVDNNNAAVQALRLAGNTLVDNFTYTVRDAAGGTDQATLAITIQGANDAPVGVDDVGAALEAGGAGNGTPGTPATGNVLPNDTDVDSVANGEGKNVTGIRSLAEAAGGALTTVPASGNTVIAGLYGTLTIDATGAYSYVVDQANATVQALAAGQTLHEFFTYQVSDVGDAVNGRLSDLAQLDITITGANDNPVATDDVATAVEAGGVNNATPGTNPAGNVLTDGTPDSDLDGPAIGLAVSAVRTGAEAGSGTAGTVGTALAGQYGSLVLGADGSYTYTVDNNNAAVQALRLAGNTLVDNFTYTVRDAAGGTDQATLAITIQGANDAPVGVDDIGAALEAGGAGNGTPGTPATGNVLPNDTDVDSVANGEGKNVTGIRSLAEAAGGALTTVPASGNTVIAGLYGTLTIDATGAYSYVVDQANATVQALAAGQTLHEFFTYQVSDVGDAVNGRLSDLAQLDITITGANDNPVATDDVATAVEAGGVNNATPGVNPGGNVLTGGTPDSDLDGPAIGLAVSAVRTGAEAGSGTAGTVGTALAGQYGSLVLGADGSYTYTVDNNNAAVQALRLAGNTLVDNFTYTVRDAAGGTDQATLAITIQGANDTPVAVNDVADALEAGGVANGSPGLNPTGNVITDAAGRDSDVDQFGEVLSVTGFTHAAGTGTVDTPFTATYGSLLLHADGSYTYTVDNDNATVQALRLPSDTLTEVFTYTLRDALGATTTATLTVTIHGRDDTPVAGDDLLVAQEAGGTFNATPGINPLGNLLANDSDVDGTDLRTLIGIRGGARDDPGTFTAIERPSLVDGLFGSLSIDRNGDFFYVVRNTAAVIERLRAGDTLTENFTYETSDIFGATDVAQVTVVIQGAWDAPVGNNDVNIATTGTIRNPGLAVDAVGNVLTNDTDVDIPDPSKVGAVGVGAEGTAAAMQLVAAGTPRVIDGLYGTLTINTDGSYDYKVDLLNLEVLALGPGQFLNEFFTYEVVDNGGLTDLAQLRIIVRGQNNAPLSLPDAGAAVEAGGLENSVAGVNPGGNVFANDVDIDGDPMTLIGISGAGGDGTVGQVLRGQWGDLLIGADGSWSYTVDNALPAVEALRVSGQFLQDVFTYTVTDPLGDSNTARLTITIDGRNDTPIARDDTAVAVESGGVANATPGVDPSGNVLDNDSDVDSIANGESKHVAAFGNSAGTGAVAGTTLAGLYGSLTLNADGSWRYVVDNANPVVEAMRTADESLVDSFSYTMNDTAGAVSQARLVIVVRGADDFPVARNDSNVAADQIPAPHATGNVLPNDSDVDGGDALHVAAIRTGAEAGSGTAGSLGQALAGRYGTLVIQPDGSYTYSIDLNNPDVLAHAGAGRVLQDVFTYTVADRTGGTDLAELVITLDIAAPYVPPGPHGYGNDERTYYTFDKYFEPIVYVGPAVERDAIEQRISRTLTEGSQTTIVFDRGIQSVSLGEGLGKVSDQYVRDAVAESRLASQLDLAQFLTRHGRVNLSADGLLSDPSLFADTDAALTLGPAQREGADSGNNKGETPNGNGRNTRGRTAAAFTEQIRLASQRVGPDWFQ